MTIWIVIVPDNEILGAFSTKEKALLAIECALESPRKDYFKCWDLEPQEIELDLNQFL